MGVKHWYRWEPEELDILYARWATMAPVIEWAPYLLPRRTERTINQTRLRLGLPSRADMRRGVEYCLVRPRTKASEEV
ncbi:MAG: hypothetical protein CL858_13565 [Cupriavidus sp.]|jgi:hypothetical protein|nr:hypothetical protein [Cupriavidus sp.]